MADICGYIVEHHDRLGWPPMAEEEMSTFRDLVREQSAKTKAILGDDFDIDPEDFIDLRPKYAALQQEFLRLAQNRQPE